MVSTTNSWLSRRVWLGAAGVLAAAGWFARGWFTSEDPVSPTQPAARSGDLDPLAKELLETLSYLIIPEDVAARYVKDAREKRKRKKLKANNSFYTTFLMSTDFFMNGANEETPLSYVSYYSAGSRPCGHPFARFD